jgi:hypothetical protein
MAVRRYKNIPIVGEFIMSKEPSRRRLLKAGVGLMLGSVGATLFSDRSTVLAQDFPPFSSSPVPPEDPIAEAIRVFQYLDRQKGSGFAGGYPNFYRASAEVGGAIFLRTNAAVWRDVSLAHLGNPALDDFVARFKATHDYARRNGFIGGFPNFNHADHGNGIVCGTILVKESEGAMWQDVPLAELGNNIDDIEARFKGTHDYARSKGFIGGFPNFYHANHGSGIVCGTILLKESVAEWRDAQISPGVH